MKNILMVLTNARLDCVKLALDMLIGNGEHRLFDRIVFLLNKPADSHLRGIDAYIQRYPDIAWDKIMGDGTRPTGIAAMQNRCIERYPGCLYMKIDEDVFVGKGWAARMVEAYEAHAARENLGLISPLIPNNGLGLYTLLTEFYPAHLDEFRQLFGQDPSPERMGLTWHSPKVAEWATRKFIQLNSANDQQRERLEASAKPRYIEFSRGFSIGCIAYDYRLWEKMGGIPSTDEPGWCQWIEDHKHFNVLDCSQLVLHYSFFVQQEWLDRTSLIEDLIRANHPDPRSVAGPLAYHLPRWNRFARQIPGIIRRRLKPAG